MLKEELTQQQENKKRRLGGSPLEHIEAIMEGATKKDFKFFSITLPKTQQKDLPPFGYVIYPHKILYKNGEIFVFLREMFQGRISEYKNVNCEMNSNQFDTREFCVWMDFFGKTCTNKEVPPCVDWCNFWEVLHKISDLYQE